MDSTIAMATISVNQVNDQPMALADGPYLGVVGTPVEMDASASFDVEGAALSFIWDFGDGSTLLTTQAVVPLTLR